MRKTKPADMTPRPSRVKRMVRGAAGFTVTVYRSAANIRNNGTGCWFHRCAGSGNAGAEFYLGYCCQFGCGTAINYPRAAHWYTLSAKQHNDCLENMRVPVIGQCSVTSTFL
ncbi:MAG: hypothetical protein M0Z50_09885 [Planctomycetia bacterium]|nr:hypothetical protein [Planctomycetia bacterium]